MNLENLEYSEFQAGFSILDAELYNIKHILQKVINMLILDYPEWVQPTVVQVLISKAAYELTPELKKVDQLLQNESFEEPIIKGFNTKRGRPTVLYTAHVPKVLPGAEF